VTDKRVSTYLSSNMGLCISSTRLDGLRIPAVPRPVAVVLGGGGVVMIPQASTILPQAERGSISEVWRSTGIVG
jgi:hypothetical protein